MSWTSGALPPLYPAFIAITFYAFCIFIAELCRKIVDYFFKKGTTPYIFLIELIAVAQQCTCVYENGTNANFLSYLLLATTKLQAL